MIDARLNEITSMAVSEYRKIFGSALVQVILYGSYARGDFDDESDIDIVALVSCDRATISEKSYAMAEFSSDLNLQFGIMVSPSALPYDEYQRYLNDIPYYTNIAREGVELIAWKQKYFYVVSKTQAIQQYENAKIFCERVKQYFEEKTKLPT